MTTPEGYVKDQINALLRSAGAYCFMPVQMGYGKKTVDFLVCHRGQFLAIEAKRLGAQPSKFQRITLNEIKAAGGHVIVIDGPEGLSALEAWLNRG